MMFSAIYITKIITNNGMKYLGFSNINLLKPIIKPERIIRNI